MLPARITEILANPEGADRSKEAVEICAGASGADLRGATLSVGSRQLSLSGYLPPDACSEVMTGTAAIRNREATLALHLGGEVQHVKTTGAAPEGQVFHAGLGFWASSTPGIPGAQLPVLPPLPDLSQPAWDTDLLGTAACTAGILTTLATVAFRHARDHHHTLGP
jgi:hypothetical protein